MRQVKLLSFDSASEDESDYENEDEREESRACEELKVFEGLQDFHVILKIRNKLNDDLKKVFDRTGPFEIYELEDSVEKE